MPKARPARELVAEFHFTRPFGASLFKSTAVKKPGGTVNSFVVDDQNALAIYPGGMPALRSDAVMPAAKEAAMLVPARPVFTAPGSETDS